MRRTKRSGGFFVCLIFNMFLNILWLIPAAVLLALHFLLDISAWWAIGAAIAWFVYILLWVMLIGWAGRCGSEPDAPKENKNPYSAGNGKENT